MKIQVVVMGIVILLIGISYSGCVEEPQRRFGNMKLSSPAFENEGIIPTEYTCDGADVSPPLIFSDVPENTTSLALIMDDPDAPGGTFVHWLVWNISANISGFSKGEDIVFPQGMNDFGTQKYGGPCPPSGTHRYFFKLYALDTTLALQEGSTKSQLEETISGHIIEEAELIGTYSR